MKKVFLSILAVTVALATCVVMFYDYKLKHRKYVTVHLYDKA